MLNSLHGVLLRFREDVEAACGDVSKMYYMVLVAPEDQYMQLFVWQWPGEDIVRTYMMRVLIMGNKPSSNYSIIAVKETAQMGDNPEKFPRVVRALVEDSYMDDVFPTAPDKETIVQDAKDITTVAASAGFRFKDFIFSGEEVEEKTISVKLPNAIGGSEEKALGLGWEVKEDLFYVRASVNFSKKKGNVVTGENMVLEDIIDKNIPVLTPRNCLGQLHKVYDPLGLVLPFTMKGKILFRETLLIMKKEHGGKIQWDQPIPSCLRSRWIEFFQEIPKLKDVKFRRSVKPRNVKVGTKPKLVTFGDGNPDSYGTVAYALWELDNGMKEANLMMAKARLGPVTHLGETVKHELCAATISSRLKEWILTNTRLEFDEHIPFLDSQIVLAMIQRETYGFNTFAGLRVGEIQQKTTPVSYTHLTLPTKA